MTLSCIIIDDDLFAIEQLVEYIGMIPALKITKTYLDPKLAMSEISALKEPVDFLFSDIEMGSVSGLDLAKTVSGKIKCLVLVSSHYKYVQEGYDVNARHFLHKPFDFKKFDKTISLLVSRIFPEKHTLPIKLAGYPQPFQVPISDIIMIEGAWDYVKIHTRAKTYITYMKLKSIENTLSIHPNFRRINKSFIINGQYLDKVDGYNILLKGGFVAAVGRSYQKEFRKTPYSNPYYLNC